MGNVHVTIGDFETWLDSYQITLWAALSADWSKQTGLHVYMIINKSKFN